MKKYAGRIFLVFLAFIASLIAGELYLRRFAPQPTIEYLAAFSFNCFAPGDAYYLKMVANKSCTLASTIGAFDPITFQTNEWGMRSPPIAIPKPRDTTRILVVGDSIVFGWGVVEEKTFIRLTENALRQQFPGKTIEIINAGLPASGLGYEYLFLKEYLDRLDPDIVIAGFYPYTDIPSGIAVNPWDEVDELGLPTKISSLTTYVGVTGMIRPKMIPKTLQTPYLNYSHVYIFLMAHLFRQDIVTPLNDDHARLSICLYKKNCHELDEAKDKAKKLIIAMDEFVRKKGKKVLILKIPSEFAVSDNVMPGKYGGIEAVVLPWDKDMPPHEFTPFF